MALTWSRLLLSRSSPTNYSFFSDLTLTRSAEMLCLTSSALVHRSNISVEPPFPFTVKLLTPGLQVQCFAKSTEEEQWTAAEIALSSSSEARHDEANEAQRSTTTSSGDSLSLGIREPVYECTQQTVPLHCVLVILWNSLNPPKYTLYHLILPLCFTSILLPGLRPRDVRSVDPSLFLTNSMPSLLVREHAILLNLGSLRAIAMQERVLLFDYNCKGGKAFLESLLPRLNPKNNNGGPSMPFELEVVEAALLSRIQHLEQKLMHLEPRVQALLQALPNRLTGKLLEELRISKQTLVELGSRAGALRQMLIDLLEDPVEILRICIMGRNCTLRKGHGDVDCSVASEKQIAEEEEEEIEMLLENYLQRCESCHGQAERLLDSAREMEDSISVSLSSRRLEVSRVELLLQVGAFCLAVGALVTGIFGMNLKSYLEERVFAFWLTTAGIIVGAVVAFLLMYSYLKKRKIF